MLAGCTRTVTKTEAQYLQALEPCCNISYGTVWVCRLQEQDKKCLYSCTRNIEPSFFLWPP